MGYVILSLVVVIIIFLILREFWCWYFKINEIVLLLREQIRLLDRQSGISAVVLSKEYSPTHKVKLFTDADGLGLRREPKSSINPFTRIPNGTEVQQINTGDKVTLLEKEGAWYEIITKDNVRGWCFSGSPVIFWTNSIDAPSTSAFLAISSRSSSRPSSILSSYRTSRVSYQFHFVMSNLVTLPQGS